MTLVVASRKGSIIGLVSDTGISKHGSPLPPNQHLPKICALTPDIAVGFCGDPDLAMAAVLGAPRENPTYRQIVDHFMDHHREAEGGVEFIVAFNHPLNKIALIRNNHLRQGNPLEWIGDQQGFEQFQKFRKERRLSNSYLTPMLSTNREEESKNGNPTFDLIGSMRTVIEGPVESVFGHPAAISNVDGSFNLRSYCITLRPFSTTELPAKVDPLRFIAQSEEARSYTFSCFSTPSNTEIQALAYHYLRGKLTFMHYGARGKPLSNMLIYREMNFPDVAKETIREFGLDWIGMLESASGIPADYGIPADEWKAQGPRYR